MNEVPSSWKKQTIIGLIVIIVGLGGFSVWASTARLDSAIVADGTVTVEGKRQEISHLEGGIVQEILVQNADVVQAGDVLVRLIPLRAQSDVATLRARLFTARVQAARLEAERAGLDKLVFPEELLESAEGGFDNILEDTIRQFDESRRAVRTQLDILSSREEQLNEQIRGRERQKAALEAQATLMQTELESLRIGVERGVIVRNRLLEMERENTRIEGEIGRAIADIAGFHERIGETRLQMEQLQQQRRELAISELPDTRVRIVEAQSGLALAMDALSRVEIRAPVSGSIQNLQLSTVGGVAGPGQPLMELVPSDKGLVVTARLSPLNRDSLDVGLGAEVRFPAFSSRTTPVILGDVERVSPDIFTEERTGEQYYELQVRVQKESIPDEIESELVPGLPAQVVAATGERTLLDYLIKPLREAIVRAGTGD